MPFCGKPGTALQGVLKHQLIAGHGAGFLLGRLQAAVAQRLEELLYGQGLGMHGAPHAALALAPGQTLAGKHDVAADGLAAYSGLRYRCIRCRAVFSIFQAK